VLLPALANAVDWARYWQEPDDVDTVLQEVELFGLLRPIADRRSPSWPARLPRGGRTR